MKGRPTVLKEIHRNRRTVALPVLCYLQSFSKAYRNYFSPRSTQMVVWRYLLSFVRFDSAISQYK